MQCAVNTHVALFPSVLTTLLCAGHEPASAFSKAKLLMKLDLNEELIEMWCTDVHKSI
jgi:hypothetical protein